MGQAMPHGGWPLRLAIFALAPPERRLPQKLFAEQESPSLVDMCEIMLSRGEARGNLSAANSMLWLDLVARHHRGEIEIEGRPAGSTEFMRLTPKHLNGATADYDGDALKCGDLTFFGVRVFEKAVPEGGELRPSLETPAEAPGASRKKDRPANRANAEYAIRTELAADKILRKNRKAQRPSEAEAVAMLAVKGLGFHGDRKVIRACLKELYGPEVKSGRIARTKIAGTRLANKA
jgi:hypothetical protein